MSEPHALSHHLTELMAHLIRSALLADDDATVARREAFRTHHALRADLGDADLSAVKLDGLWSLAKGKVETPELGTHPLLASRQLIATCPLSLDELIGPSLATAEIEETIRGSGSLG